MEDAVAIHPFLCIQHGEIYGGFHYFAVYDGHRCPHVGEWCRERLHELVREEITSMPERTGGGPVEWGDVMRRSFTRMDSETRSSWPIVGIQEPCSVGKARRKGKAIPLAVDHKPDRPDELERIHAAGGSVIYWNGARLLGVLAMSRAIGDIFLKPYVSFETEVTIMERTSNDDCLILASDGLWDVVSNQTACKAARMCLRKITAPPRAEDGVILLGQMVGCGGCDSGGSGGGGTTSDDACSDASMLLTKLAIARHSTDNVSVVVVDLR
ncbi:hypothetical protein SAY87_016672 [Trapa incisa]|uniref:PPM-type phosphatase domain-containing protein n=1 Tax=Trapa incisa TaxID=236973 RepID=A0AAN7L776_9MYRT|nr:hypothetical protein SAY87_016672 [Trapa incisa]